MIGPEAGVVLGIVLYSIFVFIVHVLRLREEHRNGYRRGYKRGREDERRSRTSSS